jgi:hypothetical protein
MIDSGRTPASAALSARRVAAVAERRNGLRSLSDLLVRLPIAELGRGSGDTGRDSVDIDGFWAIIEGTGRGTGLDERSDRLAAALTELTVEDLLDFQDHLEAQRGRVSGDVMGDAATLILLGCGDDSFARFTAWLVGLGRETMNRIAQDPDRLADEPEVQALAGRHPRDWADEEYPWWEELEFAADHEYERRELDPACMHCAQKARVLKDGPAPWPEPERDDRDQEESLPRLTAMFDKGWLWD